MLWAGTDRRLRGCRWRPPAYPLIIVLVMTALAAGGCATRRGAVGPPGAGSPEAGASSPGAPGPLLTDGPDQAGPGGRPAGTGTPTRAADRPGTGPSSTRIPRRYVFPVQTGNVSYHRTHSVYPGTDLFAACGAPVVAVTDGEVLEVSRVDRFTKAGPPGPFNGGRFVSVLGDDGVRYYGSHLTEVTAELRAGVRVRAGQRLGTVGRTGNANNVCHLHFGISPPCGGVADWWIRRGVIWPAPYLDSWRRKADRSPAKQVADWHRAHGCPGAP